MWSQQCLFADYYRTHPQAPPSYYAAYPSSSPTYEQYIDPAHDSVGLRPISPSTIKHEAKVHDLTPPESEPGDDKQFSCGHPKCSYVTNRRNNLKRHMITMHERLSSPHVCCGITFFRKADMRIHNKENHRDGYMCSWQSCGKMFLRKALLDRHLKVHTGEKPYICNICKYGTSHKSNLERHLKIHYKSGIVPESADKLDMFEAVRHIQPTSQPYTAWGNFTQLSSGRLAQQMTGWPRSEPVSDLDLPLPDSTTADMNPPSPVNVPGTGTNFDLPHPSSPRFQSLLTSPEKLGLTASFPVCDLASLTSILLSPIKTEPQRDDVDVMWRSEPVTIKEDFIVPNYTQTLVNSKEQNKVSHTIDSILSL